MTDVIDFEKYKKAKTYNEISTKIMDLGLVLGKFRLYAEELTVDDVPPKYQHVIESCTGTFEDLVKLLDKALHSIGSEDCTVDDDNEGA